MWGIWSIWPDGRVWEPIVGAFHSGQAFHFATQISNGDLVVVDYYNLNNNGFGALYRLPPGMPPGQPQFYSAFGSGAPGLDQTVGAGYHYPFTIPFQPRGMTAITPFTHPQDEAAPVGSNGVRVGKFTIHPRAEMTICSVVWTPGQTNLNRPSPRCYDAGLYLIPRQHGDGSVATRLIKNNPNYNEKPGRAPW
jgi:hypothetical protein